MQRYLPGIVIVAVVLIGAFSWAYLIEPMSDPRTTSSISAPTHGEPQNLAAPDQPAGGAKP